MCRTSVGSMRRIRKVHVDLSKCPDRESHPARRLYKLEGKIVAETLEGRTLTVQRASELSKKINEVLRKQPSSEVTSVEVILSFRLADDVSAYVIAYPLTIHRSTS